MKRKDNNKLFKQNLHRDVDTKKVIDKFTQQNNSIYSQYSQIYKGTTHIGNNINVQR